jgi:hypothetical protein
MLSADWSPAEYFAFDQLNLIVPGQYAGRHHSLIALGSDSHRRWREGSAHSDDFA